MEKMRLDKFLTSQNICSRKEAGILARKGEIKVNGAVVKSADEKIDADTAEVIGTFVYDRGLLSQNYSYATAVGLFTNVVNLILLLTVNKISEKVSNTSLF